jgi:hypothetical protein
MAPLADEQNLEGETLIMPIVRVVFVTGENM